MKKALLLSAASAALLAQSANAQRFSVYEVFSGENCPPCAAYNPGNWTLLSANTSKAMLLKYQVPIPSAGPLYNANPTNSAARRTYYGVTSAPSGGLNGAGFANIANFTQAQIDAGYNVTPSFTMSVSHSYSSDYDSVFATVTITATQAFAPANAQMKLRTAYVATMEYPVAPGTNGEKVFHNVVQNMYPNAAGTTIPNAWTVGQSQTYTVSGPIQSFVDRSNSTFVAAWIQNDADKSIALGAKSSFVPMNVDASVTGVSAPSLTCATGTSASVVTSLTLKNNGSTPLTAAKIYYRAGSGTNQVYNWTGNLAMNATANVTLPANTMPAGSALLIDSVAQPNNAMDYNPANNRWQGMAAVYDKTVVSLPNATGFENAGAAPAGWVMYDPNGNEGNWYVASGTGNVGHNNSKYLIWHNNYNYTANEVNYAIAPTPNVSAANDSIEFYVAYAQYQNENDRLDVVYSTNCGQSWTSFWNKQGAALSTAPATTSNFVPTQAQWRKEVASLGTVPAGAMVAFKATSDYGNNLFIDNVTMRVGSAASITDAFLSNSVSLTPNPASSFATLGFSLANAGAVRVEVLDAAGRVVINLGEQKMTAGTQSVNLNTAALSAGVYMVRLQSNGATINQRLSVVK